MYVELQALAWRTWEYERTHANTDEALPEDAEVMEIVICTVNFTFRNVQEPRLVSVFIVHS